MIRLQRLFERRLSTVILFNPSLSFTPWEEVSKESEGGRESEWEKEEEKVRRRGSEGNKRGVSESGKGNFYMLNLLIN